MAEGNKWPKWVKITIENMGDPTGEEIIPLYIRGVEASVPRPEKELKGFSKVSLAPGQ